MKEDLEPTARAVDMKACPFCGEDVRASALKCRHCNSFLVPMGDNIGGHGGGNNVQIVTNTVQQPQQQAVPKNSRVGQSIAAFVLAFLCLPIAGLPSEAYVAAIFIHLGILAWMSNNLKKEDTNKVLASIVVVVSLFSVFAAIGQA